MADASSTLKIQAFLNSVKTSKKRHIDAGIIVYPDIFSGQYQNELFEHRKAKDLISTKLKDIFSPDWVTVDVGIIKKERLETFLLKKGLPAIQGFDRSVYLPIVRLHKNSSSQQTKVAKKEDQAPQGAGDNLNGQLTAMIPQIVDTVTKNLEKNGKVNSKIRIPGIDPEIVFDVKAFRNFTKAVRPVIRKLRDALGFDERKDIIGSIDYYIRRDDGGILKIDIVKNRSHDIFNHAFKSRLLEIKDHGAHQKIKREIQKKRDAFLEYQKAFFAKSEARMMDDDFFLGRSKPEKKIESIEISSDISGLMDEFPDLKNEFYTTFTEKFNIILTSNNITKNDVNLDVRYVDNPEGADRIEIEFNSIENFRITRGIRKYNGIATNLPMEEEEHEALEEAIEKKNRLVEKAQAIGDISQVAALKKILDELNQLKKSFPMLVIDQYKTLMLQLQELEEKKHRHEEEEAHYADVLATINTIAQDRSKMEYELFHFSIDPDDGIDAGLKTTDSHQAKECTTFIDRIAEVVAKTPPTSLSEIARYDAFDPEATEKSLLSVLKRSFISNALLEVCEERRPKLQEELESNTTLQANLEALAKEYFGTYKNSFINAYANRFFAMTAEIASPRSIPKVVSQMIEGTQKYRPIFETETGHVTHRADQVMMRVKEANKRKEEVVADWREKVQRIENKLLKIDFEDKAYNGAAQLRIQEIKNIPPNKILEIMLNKDGKFSSEKRVFSWLDIQRIDLILQTLYKSRETKKMEGKTASLNGAIQFFESLKGTNTQEYLASKLKAHKTYLDKYSKDLDQITLRYDQEASRPLEEYDSDLRKMKKAFLENFCQPRV